MVRDDSSTPLAHVSLGDIIILPDGRGLTARSRVALPTPVHSMAGFIICGEMEVLLSTPSTSNGPVNVYVPIDYLPVEQAQCRVVAEGAARYWAPHLPALSGAMGEVFYRVLEVRGSVDPIVVVYRGQELIVFIRATFAWGDDIRVMYMDRSDANDVDVVRHSAVVDDPSLVPDLVPADERTLYHQFT